MQSFRRSLVCLVACGAVVLIVQAQTWSVVTFPQEGFPDTVLRITGRAINAVPSALALVMVTSGLGIASARGVLRNFFALVVGSLCALCALETWHMRPTHNENVLSSLVSDAVGRTVSGGFTVTTTPWLWVSMTASIAGAIASVAIVRAPNSSGSAPSRYARHETNLTPWQSLDHGQDPTVL